MNWLSYFSKKPEVKVENENRQEHKQKEREKEIYQIIKENEKLFNILKNTIISYICRKRFLKTVHASIITQRKIRRNNFKKKTRRYYTRLYLSHDNFYKLLRNSMKYRSELFREIKRVESLIHNDLSDE